MINIVVDSIDVLSHYNQLLHFETASFFDSLPTVVCPHPLLNILPFSYKLDSSNCKSFTTTQHLMTVATPLKSTNNKELPIVIDTGASSYITPISTDFTTEITKADLQELKQVNGATAVCGQGTVLWPTEDVDGVRRSITTDAYYVPDAGIR
jgi:hypothetical protein